ncbi:MAG: hypothetical protein H6686_03035 [Fibrobacteria bacterium]|nr:hypothetical protein [Fibrobacteria bacterium]
MDLASISTLMPRELSLLLPEIFLSGGLLLVMVAEFLPGGGRRTSQAMALLVALCTLVLSFTASATSVRQGYAFEPDMLTRWVRVYASLGSILAIAAMMGSARWKNRAESGEGAMLVLGVALGAMLFASATNLLALLLALEFLSLSSYGLAGFRGKDSQAAEAGLKYVLYGGIASAISLFGMSHVFGMTGSLSLSEIGQTLAMGGPEKAVLVPLLLVGVAFGYKLSLVPFHFWGPDVYQGCPPVAAGFLSTVPKAAAFAGLIHALLLVFPSWTPLAQGSSLPIFLGLYGAVSTVVGAVAAGVQKDARRILAFSSTANAGTMLVVLSSWITLEAVAALAFFLIVYLFANFAAFIALDRLETTSGSSRLDELAGSWKRRPWTVMALALALVSLAGIPPLAGFSAKWVLLREVLRAGTDGALGMVSLVASIAILVSSVSLAWAYLRILRATAVDEGVTSTPPASGIGNGWVLAVCSLALLGLAWAFPVVEFLRATLAG